MRQSNNRAMPEGIARFLRIAREARFNFLRIAREAWFSSFRIAQEVRFNNSASPRGGSSARATRGQKVEFY